MLDSSVQRQIAKSLTALGRRDEAARSFETSRSIVGPLKDGKFGPGPRAEYIAATVRLAMLRAAAGDPRALKLANEVSALLAQGALASQFIEASDYGLLGAAYLEIAKHGAAARADRIRDAVTSLEKSADMLRRMTVAPTADADRQKELRTVEANLAACRLLLNPLVARDRQR
jgi:hypothetical protein